MMDKLKVVINARGVYGRIRTFILHIAFPGMEVRRCPMCGSLPRVRCIASCEDQEFEAKAFCSNSREHISIGDWKSSIKAALEDWNRRTTDETQPDLYKPTNLEIIRRFSPDQLARFIIWLNPNYCHNMFRPEYHSETNSDGKTYKVCAGKCTECVLRFLDAKDGIYSKWPSLEEKEEATVEKFDRNKDYHV